MEKVIIAMPGNGLIAASLAKLAGANVSEVIVRRFPDGESYVRVASDVTGRHVLVVCTMNQPDSKFLAFYFLCRALRDGGAARITFIAPYLCYMRQDRIFQPGESLTSRCFAELVSGVVDELVTIDPHLHRNKAMSAIYSIPCTVLHASQLLSTYVREHFPDAVIVGPDEESAQWVSAVAEGAGVPYVVMRKERRGDRDVSVSLPLDLDLHDLRPVLVDDIVSTGRTMIEGLKLLSRQKLRPAVCVAVHPVFAEGAYEELQKGGAAVILSCNTITHASNCIDVAPLLASALNS